MHPQTNAMTQKHIFRFILSCFNAVRSYSSPVTHEHNGKLNPILMSCRCTEKPMQHAHNHTRQLLSPHLLISLTQTHLRIERDVHWLCLCCCLPHQQLHQPWRQLSSQILSRLCSSCSALTSLSVTGVFKQRHWSLHLRASYYCG